MICTQEDDYTYEKPRWLAKLSNGQLVIGDDNRPSLTEPSAWKRLKSYVVTNELKIEEFYLQFRSHIVKPLSKNAKAYFFANGIAADWTSGFQYKSFVIGQVENDNVIITQRFCIPELELQEIEGRAFNEKYEHNIIWN